MNINLDTKILKEYNHGKLIFDMYEFKEKWVSVDFLNQPYNVAKYEVKKYKKDIKENRRVDPIVVLQEYGIVTGFHLLQAFKDLKYDRIPIIYGKIKK